MSDKLYSISHLSSDLEDSCIEYQTTRSMPISSQPRMNSSTLGLAGLTSIATMRYSWTNG